MFLNLIVYEKVPSTFYTLVKSKTNQPFYSNCGHHDQFDNDSALPPVSHIYVKIQNIIMGILRYLFIINNIVVTQRAFMDPSCQKKM